MYRPLYRFMYRLFFLLVMSGWSTSPKPGGFAAVQAAAPQTTRSDDRRCKRLAKHYLLRVVILSQRRYPDVHRFGRGSREGMRRRTEHTLNRFQISRVGHDNLLNAAKIVVLLLQREE